MPRHISISPHTIGSGSHDPIKQVWISTKITSHAKHREEKKKQNTIKRQSKPKNQASTVQTLK